MDERYATIAVIDIGTSKVVVAVAEVLDFLKGRIAA